MHLAATSAGQGRQEGLCLPCLHGHNSYSGKLDLSLDNMPSFIGMLSRLMHHTLVSSYQSKLLLVSHASHISRHRGDFVSCLASASTLSAGRQTDRRMLAARSDLQLLASKIILNAMNKEDIKPACVFSCHICSLFCLQHLRKEMENYTVGLHNGSLYT